MDTIDLAEDAEMEGDELVADDQEGGRKKSLPAAMRPFRTEASPTGVAKTHLKTKEGKEAKGAKDKSKEKEDK